MTIKHPLRFILTAGIALAALGTSSQSATFQVAADTSGSTVTHTILKPAGLSPTLPVSGKSTAFIKFGVGNSGINPADLVSARLVIYFPKVTTPGNLYLGVLDSDFSENFPTKNIPAPSASTLFPAFPVTTADTKNFVTLDVSGEVYAWLSSPNTDFGFGIFSADKASVTIGSKEGTGSGYPAVLEVEVRNSGAIVGTSANFSEQLAGTTAVFTSTITGGSGIFNGSLSATSAFFTDQITGTSATFSNDLSAAAANFTGVIHVAPLQALNEPIIKATGTTNSIIHTESIGTGAAGIIQKNSTRQYFTGISNGDTSWTLRDSTAVADRLTVTSNGNIGIGNSTPAFALDIAGGGDTQFAVRSTSSNGRVYTFQSSNGGAALGDGAFQIVDRTAGAARLMISKTGNVGIGSNTSAPPAAKLDVRGDVKLGSSGQLFAPGGDENLFILRGIVGGTAGAATIVKGTKFTVTRTTNEPVGSYDVSFPGTFSDIPAFTVTPVHANQERMATIAGISATSVTIKVFNKFGGLEDVDFHFTAIGPR